MKIIHSTPRRGIAALLWLLAAVAPSALHAEPVQFGDSASDRTLAHSLAVAAERQPIIDQANALASAGDGNAALDLIETHLRAYPGDIIAGNRYRKIATDSNLYDRPIRFLVGLAKDLTPCPDPSESEMAATGEAAKKEEEPKCSPDAKPPGPPAGLRYNLAFAYIDKIPVVGPMGAGFLSKRSIAQFRTALDEDPKDWIANYGVGMNYLHWPDYFEKNDSSIAYFEKAIELQEARGQRPSDILAYVRLGDALAKADQPEPARAAWQRGSDRLGAHADLDERLEIAVNRLKQSVSDAYNPNNSIGAIDTDISILWAESMPAQVFSLLNPDGPVVVGGVGGQTLPERDDHSEIRLFNWFRDNLPLLMKRENADRIDMSGIGVTSGQGSGDGVGVIAYNMIQGFMTQFRGDDDASVIQALAAAPDYDRPFFHEGVGMGLAAALDTSADGSLAPFADEISALDPSFDRLHYAGLGMWYGLAPTVNMVRVRSKLGELDLRGHFYAYEGMGFAVTLFKESVDSGSGALDLIQRLPFASASTFAHGAGRALWIKHGDNHDTLLESIERFPRQFHSDLRAGFGMGVAFTRIDRLEQIGEQATPFRDQGESACVDYLTGSAMGLGIRYQSDPRYVRTAMRNPKQRETRMAAAMLLRTSLSALSQIERIGTEMHRNWRGAIRNQLTRGTGKSVVREICGG